MWPPDSVPSATTASAPPRSMSFASATLATTGITLIPAAFHISMYFAGFPAPVVTTFTFSSAITFAISSASGFMSIKFTPKGLSVSFFAAWICSLTQDAGAPPAPIMPRPPALDTALASSWVATQAIPPWMTGYSIPRSSVTLVFISSPSTLLMPLHPCQPDSRLHPVRSEASQDPQKESLHHTPPPVP